MDFGPWEILIVAVVVLVLFGSKKLPDAARSLGRSMRILKAETKGLRDDDADPTATVATAGTTPTATVPPALTAPAPVATTTPAVAPAVPQPVPAAPPAGPQFTQPASQAPVAAPIAASGQWTALPGQANAQWAVRPHTDAANPPAVSAPGADGESSQR